VAERFVGEAQLPDDVRIIRADSGRFRVFVDCSAVILLIEVGIALTHVRCRIVRARAESERAYQNEGDARCASTHEQSVVG
jgi:hypothetical protein